MESHQVAMLSTCLILCAMHTANAALYSNPDGTLVYDSDRNITWLADANYAGTLGINGSLGPPENGRLNREDALAWVASLSINGITGWRLPLVAIPDPTCRIQDSGAPRGYDCTGGEMGHLYYEELEGRGNIYDNHNENYYLFKNIPPERPIYWTGTDLESNAEWAFNFNGGLRELLSRGGDVWRTYMWPVHDGDVTRPTLAIEKKTNGKQADTADDKDVPRILLGDMVTWTYEVTNTSAVAASEAEILVTGSQSAISPVLDVGSDEGGDMILSPAETWVYSATTQAVDLTNPPAGITVVPGCNDSRNTYENIGRVEIVATEIFDEDLSHYCNPSDYDGDGIPDHEDNCLLIANGPLKPDTGGNSQLDTDGDGYGNSCDPDFDNNLTVDFADLAVMKSVFFTANPDADLNGNGNVDFADLSILKSMFFRPPGPTGVAP